MAGTTLYFQSTDSGIPHPSPAGIGYNFPYYNLAKSGYSPLVTGAFVPTGNYVLIPLNFIAVSDAFKSSFNFNSAFTYKVFGRSALEQGTGTALIYVWVVDSGGNYKFNLIASGSSDPIDGSISNLKALDGPGYGTGLAVAGDRLIVEYFGSNSQNPGTTKIKSAVGRPSGVSLIDTVGYSGVTTGVPWMSTSANLPL